MKFNLIVLTPILQIIWIQKLIILSIGFLLLQNSIFHIEPFLQLFYTDFSTSITLFFILNHITTGGLIWFLIMWFIFPFARWAPHFVFLFFGIYVIKYHLITNPLTWLNLLLIGCLLPFAKYYFYYFKLWPIKSTMHLVLASVFIYLAILNLPFYYVSNTVQFPKFYGENLQLIFFIANLLIGFWLILGRFKKQLFWVGFIYLVGLNLFYLFKPHQASWLQQLFLMQLSIVFMILAYNSYKPNEPKNTVMLFWKMPFNYLLIIAYILPVFLFVSIPKPIEITQKLKNNVVLFFQQSGYLSEEK